MEDEEEKRVIMRGDIDEKRLKNVQVKRAAREVNIIHDDNEWSR